MFDLASQVGAVIGTSVILYIATKPKRAENDPSQSHGGNSPVLNMKGARKYSREGRKQTSFGNHDDFDM